MEKKTEKHFKKTQPQQNMKTNKGQKADIWENKHGRPPQVKNHNQNQYRKHHSEDEDSHDTYSTPEDSVFNDPPHGSRHHHSNCHKQSHHSLSTSNTSIATSSLSSSSTLSSSSSFSSSSSATSSSSSRSSSDSSDSESSNPRCKPKHSRSCTDISRKTRYFDESDETAPLLEGGESLNRIVKQGSPPKSGQSHGGHTTDDGNVRKAKSMESLARPKQKEEETRKNEATKNIVKEKMKFSAFLNEITRQVLSPMRLTTLGVTNAQRPSSPGQASARSTKSVNSLVKQEQHKHFQGSADSASSGKLSHGSSKHSHSRQRHYSHHTEGSPDRKTRQSFKRHHSWSSRQRSCSPSGKHHDYYNHHGHGSPSYEKDYQHHHNCGRHCSPTYYHHDHHKPSHHQNRHHHQDDHHLSTSHYCKDHSASEHGSNGENRKSHCRNQRDIHLSHLKERSISPHHHRYSNDSSDYDIGSITNNHHGDHCDSNYHHNERDPRHVAHRRDHHSEPRHHHSHGYHHHRHREPRHQSEYSHGNCPKKHHLGIQCCQGHHRGPLSYKDHHGDHHYEPHDYCRDHHLPHHHHGDHHEPHHHHGDHHEPHHHRGDHNDPPNHHGHHHNEPLHHQGDQYKPHNYHGDHDNEPHHHHGDNHNESHHHHGDHYKPPHHHGDHYNEPHHHHGNHHNENHHHHGDHHNEPHHHHGDHHSEVHAHNKDHHNENHHHRHGDHYSQAHHHGDHHSEAHHHGDHHREAHHHHGDHRHEQDACQQKDLEGLSRSHFSPKSSQVHSKINQNHTDPGHHGKAIDKTLESLWDSPRPGSASSLDKEETSFTGPLRKESADGMSRIIIVQEQTEGLQQSLLKTAVRVECLGEEFMSSRHCLEAELQRTRVELSNLTERFKRLHDNCSSTQQTNSLLEHKLHLVAQSMEGERERLNQRISALIEQLADSKFANSVDTGNVVQHHVDSGVALTVPAITPPPAQFMDSFTYGKDKAAGQEQSLGSVPEEEESDWSEIGEETPRFVLTGLNRGQVWRRRQSDADKASESEGEGIYRPHSPRPSPVPHLQLSVPNEGLPFAPNDLSDIETCESCYKFTTSPGLGSAVLFRSASLEDISLGRHSMHKELQGTEAVMDLHHSGAGAAHDIDNEVFHHLRNNRDTEMDTAMSNLQSAERILNHLISETRHNEGTGECSAEVHGWPEGIPDEFLEGERTKL